MGKRGREPDFMAGSPLEQRTAAYEWLKEIDIDERTVELLIRLDSLLDRGDEGDALRLEGFRYALKALGIASAIERIAKYDYFGGRRGAVVDEVIARWR